jgi:hypothetical protein
MLNRADLVGAKKVLLDLICFFERRLPLFLTIQKEHNVGKLAAKSRGKSTQLGQKR